MRRCSTAHHAARVQVASPLGARAVANMPLVGFAKADGPLGGARATAVHDFSYGLGDVVTHYVMDLYPGAVRVPISSWQATLQTGAKNYVQGVVPGCRLDRRDQRCHRVRDHARRRYLGRAYRVRNGARTVGTDFHSPRPDELHRHTERVQHRVRGKRRTRRGL